MVAAATVVESVDLHTEANYCPRYDQFYSGITDHDGETHSALVVEADKVGAFFGLGISFAAANVLPKKIIPSDEGQRVANDAFISSAKSTTKATSPPF